MQNQKEDYLCGNWANLKMKQNSKKLRSGFFEKVYAVVRGIPKGRVMSYGQVALFLDMPRGAREVGWALSMIKDSDMVPWWRVVNGEGRVSIKGKYSADEQRELLKEEGVQFSKDFTFDIEKYRFIPGEHHPKNVT